MISGSVFPTEAMTDSHPSWAQLLRTDSKLSIKYETLEGPVPNNCKPKENPSNNASTKAWQTGPNAI